MVEQKLASSVEEHVLYCLIMGVLRKCGSKSLDFYKYWEVCCAKKMDLSEWANELELGLIC
jgi:hypothetical protein